MQYLKFIFYPALHLFVFAILAVLIDPVLGVIYFIIAMYLLFKNKRIPKEDIESEKEAIDAEKEAKRIKEKGFDMVGNELRNISSLQKSWRVEGEGREAST